MATKPIFKTPYGEREQIYTNPGSPIQNEYGYEINKYGLKELVKTGETNLYEIIQESLEDTKIENILKRVAAGDNSVMRPNGIYADVAEAPKSLLEARQQMQKLENTWNKLDTDIKRKYDFSVEKFIAEAGSSKWLEDMGIIQKKVEPEPTPTPSEPKAEPAGKEA